MNRTGIKLKLFGHVKKYGEGEMQILSSYTNICIS